MRLIPPSQLIIINIHKYHLYIPSVSICRYAQTYQPKEDFPGCGSHFPWIFGGIPGYDSLEAVKMLARH